jgi:hypothetical protein
VPRSDWSRKLPHQMIVADVLPLSTLSDVRDLIDKHLPTGVRERDTWRHVAAKLAEASRGAVPAGLVIVLRVVLSLENVTCVVK